VQQEARFCYDNPNLESEGKSAIFINRGGSDQLLLASNLEILAPAEGPEPSWNDSEHSIPDSPFPLFPIPLSIDPLRIRPFETGKWKLETSVL